MRFQISFERLGKVHWVFASSEDAAQYTIDALQVASCSNIDVLDCAERAHPKRPSWFDEAFTKRNSALPS